jgi:hypothetical protein
MFRQDEIIIIQPQRGLLIQHGGAVARSRPRRNRCGPIPLNAGRLLQSGCEIFRSQNAKKR